MYIHLTPDLQNGKAKIWENKMERWLESAYLGYSEEHREKFSSASALACFIAEVLYKVAAMTGVDVSPITLVKGELLRYGEETKVWMKNRIKQKLKI